MGDEEKWLTARSGNRLTDTKLNDAPDNLTLCVSFEGGSGGGLSLPVARPRMVEQSEQYSFRVQNFFELENINDKQFGSCRTLIPSGGTNVPSRDSGTDDVSVIVVASQTVVDRVTSSVRTA